MKGKKYSVEDKIRILRQAEGGRSILEVCREANISEVTFHRWKNQFGQMEVSEAKRLKAAGCEVFWLEIVEEDAFVTELLANVATLKCRLERFGLQASLRVRSETSAPLPMAFREQYPGIDEIIEADLFLSLRYATRPEEAGRFRKTALVDIDPGLLQSWISKGRSTVKTLA
jgi:transposase-like protein